MKYELKENVLTTEIYADLRESVSWKKLSESQTQNALEHSFYTITAFDDTKAIGMGRVVGDGIYLSIVDLVVRPEYQGNRVGSAIIKAILNDIENHMNAGDRVSLQLISEKGKEEFYRKQGFELIPNEYSGASLCKLIYK